MNFEEFAEVECPQVFASDLAAEIDPEQVRINLSGDQVAVTTFSQWQHDLCTAHGDFNNWRGCCPMGLDQCLITKTIDSGGSLDRLKGLEIGQGVTADQVIDLWLETGEPAADLINQPAWFIAMADHLRRRTNGNEKTT